LTRSEKLRKELEEFKNDRRAERTLAEIEKWMISELGVTRIETGSGAGKKKGKGSVRTYYHEAIEALNEHGHFVVHVLHKKREMILRASFRRFLYPWLKVILDWIEAEEEA
jgi:hypothetical protein